MRTVARMASPGAPAPGTTSLLMVRLSTFGGRGAQVTSEKPAAYSYRAGRGPVAPALKRQPEVLRLTGMAPDAGIALATVVCPLAALSAPAVRAVIKSDIESFQLDHATSYRSRVG